MVEARDVKRSRCADRRRRVGSEVCAFADADSGFIGHRIGGVGRILLPDTSQSSDLRAVAPAIAAGEQIVMTKSLSRCLQLIAVVGAYACSGATTPTLPAEGAADPGLIVRDVAPASGAVSVNPAAPVVISFSHAMMTGMEFLVVLHEGAVTGPQVVGTTTWSSDRLTLTFTPAQPLKSKTTYVLHLSPNLKDANGQPLNFPWCAQHLGGQAASGATLGGMMGSGSGGMMGSGSGGMMGSGWQAGSGAWGYGMTFTFTTA